MRTFWIHPPKRPKAQLAAPFGEQYGFIGSGEQAAHDAAQQVQQHWQQGQAKHEAGKEIGVLGLVRIGRTGQRQREGSPPGL